MPNGFYLRPNRWKFIANFTRLMTDTTLEEKEKDQSKEIHVHENGNKNIMIIDGTQSAAASSTYALFFFVFFLFPSPRKIDLFACAHTIASSHSPTNEINKEKKSKKKNWMRGGHNTHHDGWSGTQEGANKWTTPIIIAWHSRTYLFPLSNAPQAIKSITITALKLWYWIKVTRPLASSVVFLFFSHLKPLIHPYLQLLECHRTTEQQHERKEMDERSEKNCENNISCHFCSHLACADGMDATVSFPFPLFFFFRFFNLIAYICLIDHHSASVVPINFRSFCGAI